MKELGRDRTTRTVYIALVVLCLVVAIYFATRIRISDILVATHYTSFGGVNFYATQWWYAIAFSAFFVIIGWMHVAVGMKLIAVKDRVTSIGFGLFSIVFVVFAAITLTHIINVAFPS